MNWLAGLVALVLQKLIPWALTKLMEYFQKKNEIKGVKTDIDAKLQTVKDAYTKAFNGEPITPEQRKELHRASSDFIRGDATTGGL